MENHSVDMVILLGYGGQFLIPDSNKTHMAIMHEQKIYKLPESVYSGQPKHLKTPSNWPVNGENCRQRRCSKFCSKWEDLVLKVRPLVLHERL